MLIIPKYKLYCLSFCIIVWFFRISMDNQALKAKAPFFIDEDKCRDIEKVVEDVLKRGLSDRTSVVRVYRRASSHSFLMKEVISIKADWKYSCFGK